MSSVQCRPARSAVASYVSRPAPCFLKDISAIHLTVLSPGSAKSQTQSRKMNLVWVIGVLCASSLLVSGMPYRKSVNPCGIVYDQLGSERYRLLQSRRALASRIREILPLLNASFPEEFTGYKIDTQAWIPDASAIDGSIHFSKQLFEINRNLKYFSCALDILEKDLSHLITTCRYHLPQFHHLIKSHRLLVCETDAVMGILGQKFNADYPSLTVDVPSDWYDISPDCTQSGFILSVVYSKYKYYLETFHSILESSATNS